MQRNARQCKTFGIAITLLIAFLIAGLSGVATAAPLPFVRGHGSTVVDDQGNRLVLRGCNLGNWLILESWMLGWENVGDQAELHQTLTDRFGAAEADRLVALYRDGYITPRDFELIKSFNFNVVRVPFDSRMMIDADGKMRPDAFKYMDRALEMADQAGVYLILDMHGAPGSQSKQDHTGQRDQNKLWSEPANKAHMVALWKKIAERYKDRSVVAAYDVLNEPYGDFQSDYRAPLRELMPRCYEAIRSTGDKHLIIFPNGLGTGPTFYDDPKSEGMEQVASTDHYYAGLFGSPTTIRSHANMFGRTMPEAQEYLDRVGSPMLIGEFNVVLSKAGGKPMMRRYYDEFARRGWMATMWSYKSLKPAAGVQNDNWYMATNAEALPKIDLKTNSLAEIESAIKAFATMPLAVDEKLRSALIDEVAPSITLPKLAELPTAAPAERIAGKWKLIDVNTAVPAGVIATGENLSIFAAGTDIFGERDGFSFLQQPAGMRQTLIATVNDLADSDTWAKAGLMIRFGDPASKDYAAAPFVMLNTFVDGGVGLVVRDGADKRATETKRAFGPLPLTLALVRDESRVDAYVADGANRWVKVGSATINENKAQIGIAVCSHRDRGLTKADFADVSLKDGDKLPGTAVNDARVNIREASPNLLKNQTLRDAGDDTHIAAGWNQWGSGFRREQETKALVWAGENGGESGLWQDINVLAGQTYAFAVRLRREGSSGKAPRVSITLEGNVDGNQVALAERSIDFDQLESNLGWSVVRIQATATGPQMRAIVRMGSDEPATSGIAIDLTSFQMTPDK
jgi:endoglucanase